MHARSLNDLKKKNTGGACAEYICLVFRNYVYLMNTEVTVWEHLLDSDEITEHQKEQ